MTPKKHFEKELEPLLVTAEKAIKEGDILESRRMAILMLELVLKYSEILTMVEMRDALNNPKANAVARRLGIEPKAS